MVLNLDLKKDKVLIGGEAVRRGAWGVGSPSASSRYKGKGSSVASALRDLFILCRHRICYRYRSTTVSGIASPLRSSKMDATIESISGLAVIRSCVRSSTGMRSR